MLSNGTYYDDTIRSLRVRVAEQNKPSVLEIKSLSDKYQILFYLNPIENKK